MIECADPATCQQLAETQRQLVSQLNLALVVAIVSTVSLREVRSRL